MNYLPNDNEIERAFTQIEQQNIPVKTEVAKEDKYSPITAGQLLQEEFSETTWLVESLVPTQAIVALSGAPRSYKTWIALELARTVALGKPLFGTFQTQQAGVLIVDEENSKQLVQQRMKLLGDFSELPIYFMNLNGFKVSNGSINWMKSYVKKHGIKLIIFDSLIRIHTGDENDASKMSQVFQSLRQLTTVEVSVIFTHHHRKSGNNFIRTDISQDMRGSSDILAAVDIHIALDRKDTAITLTQTKNRLEAEYKPFKVTLIKNESGQIEFIYEGAIEPDKTRIEEAKFAAFELIKNENRPLYQKEILDLIHHADMKIGEKALSAALKECLANEELFEKKGERTKKYYWILPDFPEDNDPELPMI